MVGLIVSGGAGSNGKNQTPLIDFVTYVYVAAAEQNIDGWYWIKSAVLHVK